MEIRGAIGIVMMAFLGTLAACSGGTTVTGTGAGPDASSGGAPPSSNASGSCTGVAVGTRMMSDITSCQLQGGKWDSVYKECNSSVVSDSNKCTNETSSGKERCIQLLGCTWTDADGTASQNADLGGTCSGQPLPCADLPRNNCREAAGCEYKPTAMVCETKSPPTPARCSTFSPATTPDGSSRHPSTARGLCLSVLGCTFTRTDGTSEAAKPL